MPAALRARPRALAVAALLALLAPAPARAVLDINDRGPVLNAGNFAMRVTNAGLIGNAFYNKGLSFDPSFEYPKGSGQELMNHGELWVGGRLPNGDLRVSGGPMLEWRPTLDPADHVLTAWAGTPGTKRGVDDDGDGRIDEEILNGKDDDGDGEIDEDLGVPSQEEMAADYVDDRPEAINYGYPNGETHEPLGLSVHQECYAWSLPGYDGIAGVEFTITNHGDQTVSDVLMGLYCDLDSRRRDDASGHLNDIVTWRDYSLVIPGGDAAFGPWLKHCFETFGGHVPVVADGNPNSNLPAVAVIPLRHTTDPLDFITNTAFEGVAAAHARARAPGKDTTFRYTVFGQSLPPGQGGPPVLDADRYAALRGLFPPLAHPERPQDVAVLLSCGPFATLAPGQSLQFAVAFVAASSPDSLVPVMVNAAYLHRGKRLNLLPDSTSLIGGDPANGYTGINGHEICYEPPPGITFHYDPNCPQKFIEDPAYKGVSGFPPGTAIERVYAPGKCIWTDADCDACTGWDGAETVVHWLDPGTAPPPPGFHAAQGDHVVTVAWDNRPEILLKGGVAGTTGYGFAGYRVYRLSNWTRSSEVPPPTTWELIAAFGPDTLQRETPLAAITDTTLDYDTIEYGQKHYPIGRYRLADREVLNGFDYLYAVTTVTEKRVPVGTTFEVDRLESPIVASIDSIVVPHVAARPGAASVWVVPNPYRAHAPWDRPPVPGDPFGRHIDFFGLPKARATIRIYTLAGDFVAQVDHDGSGGDGQASWNLISRNGQDVESGIYLFTVESPAGHATGKFVLIR